MPDVYLQQSTLHQRYWEGSQMRIRLLDRDKWNFYSLIYNPLFFIVFFFYTWLKINPVLYFQEQQPAFYSGKTFLNDFLSWPGGLLDYLSAFLAQFYYIPIVGALVVTVIACLISYVSFKLVQKFSYKHTVQIIHLIPSILLLVLQ